MLAYSGKGRFVIERLDLSAQVQQIIPLIQASIPKKADLQLGLGSGLPPIDADAGQLQQVIMNLIINGAEALNEAPGTVEVRTYVEWVGQETLGANVTRQEVPAGQFVVLEVRDTGIGMDEQTRSRIFDPFFTTKFAGRGLGLSAVLGIVRSHHGALIVDSRPGSGTTFRVYFPAVNAGTAPEQTVRVLHAH
jgi:signal transduction histidine kinase